MPNAVSEVLDGLNRYTYCGNSPVMYTDPSGNFLTWGSDGNGGFSIGLNFGFFGFGIDFGNGYVGVYGEVGPRIGSVGVTLRAGIGYDITTDSVGGYVGMYAGIDTPMGRLGVSYTAGSWNLGSLSFYNADMIAKEEKMYQKICLELEQQLAQINLEYNSIVNSIRPDDDLYCDAGGSDVDLDTEKKSHNFFQWLFDKGIWLDFPGCGPSIGGLMAQGYSEDEALSIYTENGIATGIGSIIAAAGYGGIIVGGEIVTIGLNTKVVEINFSIAAAKHMTEPGRFVPIQILQMVINNYKGVPDNRGSDALMYYGTMIKNGATYAIEVLYNNTTNTIYHFLYHH